LETWELERSQDQFYATVAKCADAEHYTGEDTGECEPTDSSSYDIIISTLYVQSKIVRRYIDPKLQYTEPSQALYTADNNEVARLYADEFTKRFFAVTGNWNYYCGSKLANIGYLTQFI